MSEEAAHLLVVYDDPSDQRSLSFDDTSSTEESPDETRLSLETANDMVPYIGQRFATHDLAYEFYSEYAKRCGFSIRRHRTEGKDGVGKGLTRRYFVCHRAGNTPVKPTNENKPQRNRKSSRNTWAHSEVYLLQINNKNMMSEEAAHLLVVYDDPSDQRSLSFDDTSSTEESPDETRLSLETANDMVPYIGQRFATHDLAYEFYSEYAKLIINETKDQIN
ncbi:hypothetical protein ACFE04_024409 [Oxalis oulophora]